MTTQKLKPWELKLSPVHLVIVLGLITGSMAGAFYLGFSSGQHVGYESALHATLSNMARLPIPADESDVATTDEVTSEVYAKLTNPVEKDDLPAGKDGKGGDDMPELGAIATTDTLPILPDSVTKEGAGTDAPTETVGSLVNRAANSEAAEREAQEQVKAAAASSAAALQAASSLAASSQSAAAASSSSAAAMKSAASSSAAAAKAAASSSAAAAKAAADAQKAEELTNKAEPVGATMVRAVIPSGWYVQVAAPRKIEEANEIAASLKRAKIPVMIEAAQVRGEEYFRVVAGPQPQRSGAEKVMAQIKSKTSLKGDPFVRAVK